MPSLDRLRSYGPTEIAALTFGLTALAAVLIPVTAIVAGELVPLLAVLVPVIAVVGWFVLTPLAAIRGWGGSLDESARAESAPSESVEDPVERLREQYADGEIDEIEFERRLETVLATEEADSETAHDAVTERRRERDVE